MILVNESPTFLADPFITQVVAGLSNYLNQNGYGLVLEGLTRQEFRNSPLIRDLRTDAFCVMLSGRDSERRGILDTLAGLNQPIVLFQERPSNAVADVCAIRQDDRNGGRMLAEHLLELGARRILFLAPALTWPAISERVKGIRQALAASSSGAIMQVIPCGDGSFSAAEAPLAAHVEANGFPDAIMGGNDQLGIAGLKLATSRGLRVAEDVLVTGFNAFEFWRYTDPVLTTVYSPAYEIGAKGGATILERLQSGAFSSRDVVLPVELRIAGSTQPPGPAPSRLNTIDTITQPSLA
jgi:DNA-binding LacI/PurR family transcriptional regulator